LLHCRGSECQRPRNLASISWLSSGRSKALAIPMRQTLSAIASVCILSKVWSRLCYQHCRYRLGVEHTNIAEFTRSGARAADVLVPEQSSTQKRKLVLFHHGARITLVGDVPDRPWSAHKIKVQAVAVLLKSCVFWILNAAISKFMSLPRSEVTGRQRTCASYVFSASHNGVPWTWTTVLESRETLSHPRFH
jgi:hypothetical protein